MPNTKSAMKELRKTKKRTVHNLRIKRKIRDMAKDILKAVEVNDLDTAKKIFPEFQKTVDKAAKVNIIKKNAAARKKSRLNKRIIKSDKK